MCQLAVDVSSNQGSEVIVRGGRTITDQEERKHEMQQLAADQTGEHL